MFKFKIAIFIVALGFIFNLRAAKAGEPNDRAAQNDIDWVRVPAGKFSLGEAPSVHTYTLEQPITIPSGPITCEQYARFLKATGRTAPVFPTDDVRISELASRFIWKGQEPPKGFENWPVTFVTQEDALAYCQWLSQLTGLVYRLPRQNELDYCLAGAWGKKPNIWIGPGRNVAWWQLSPVGAEGEDRGSMIMSQFNLQCFPAALMEWTSAEWVASSGSGHRPRNKATHFFGMQGIGQRLEVYGLRIIVETKG